MHGGASVQGVEGVRRVRRQNGVAVVMFKKFPHCVNGRLAPTLMTSAHQPDLTFEDSIKKEILLIDMACPSEFNKDRKWIRKYQQLCYELRERRDGYKVKVTSGDLLLRRRDKTTERGFKRTV